MPFSHMKLRLVFSRLGRTRNTVSLSFPTQALLTLPKEGRATQQDNIRGRCLYV